MNRGSARRAFFDGYYSECSNQCANLEGSQMADELTRFSIRVRCAECGSGFPVEYAGPNDGTLRPSTRTCPFCAFPDPAILDTYVEQTFAPDRLAAPPRELHYVAASPYEGISPPRFSNSELSTPVDTFSRNVDRLRSLLGLPLVAIYVTGALERFGSKAKKELGESASEQDIKLRRNQLWTDEIDQPGSRQAMVDYSADRIAEITTIMDVDVWLGLEASLMAQLTGMWTAFEYLAGDLWKAVFNACPQASSVFREKPILLTDSLLHKIAEGPYDMHAHMGDLVADANWLKFTTVDSIRKSYEQGFKSHSAPLKAILKDRCFDSLAAVRNVIVHKAGIVDDDYRQDQKSAPTAPVGRIGRKVPIDGLVVNQLVTPVARRAVELIGAVDTWLTRTKAELGYESSEVVSAN
jgi:hypothetical protein